MFPLCQLHWTFLQQSEYGNQISEAFKGLQLTDLSKVVYFKRYYFIPTFGVQVSHFVHMAALAWCMAALQGEEFHVIGHAR